MEPESIFTDEDIREINQSLINRDPHIPGISKEGLEIARRYSGWTRDEINKAYAEAMDSLFNPRKR